jgi:hypothetical protein
MEGPPPSSGSEVELDARFLNRVGVRVLQRLRAEPIRPVPGIGSLAMQPRVWRRRQVRGRNRVQTVRSVSPSTTTPD